MKKRGRNKKGQGPGERFSFTRFFSTYILLLPTLLLLLMSKSKEGILNIFLLRGPLKVKKISTDP